ncbi:alanine--tRNA ligase [candidate division TM6 bacterium RIFCSPHIGHO2_12_FULL_36_22]|nr:MAG: alanine--tRNA ligase [candidate division TM6 bacterium RIFCSPHIGHO2_12_FULL_36_22]
MKSTEIRKKFFDFFIRLGHEYVPSSSLIPAEDPTLLFANAGMNQFKDVFLGKEKRSYNKAVSIQKCVRAGGKHNDLDNVGFTRRHHTFFEMMGNFSFGAYFKKEAIRYAWDFLTKEMGLPKEKLYATVYKDDDEAYRIWNEEIGVPKERIFKLGEADNFWAMGDTGPCGPCTEILLDRGPEFCTKGCDLCSPEACGERFLEIWNNVFMQFNRSADGTMEPLKQKGVDTGMGLERLVSVMQGKDSAYETDLFMPIMKKIDQLTGLKYEKQIGEMRAAFRVLADHIRAACFLIADGCDPSNDGRGYVLRKIIRRAALFERKLSDKSIFVELAPVVIETMKEFYPELEINKQRISKVLHNEVNKFSQNLVRGLGILEDYFKKNKDQEISGKQAFMLYDTYGFPFELIEISAHERKWSIDKKGFDMEMEKQKAQSGKKCTTEPITELDIQTSTQFTGYTSLEESGTVKEIIKNNKLVKSVEEGDECWIICEQSPFYVECGGQVNDEGWLIFDEEQVGIHDLKKISNAIAVQITAPVHIKIGDPVISRVNADFRFDTVRNHTATHLLQAALIEIFGKEIKQAGSLVTADYLRFDFTWHENLTPDQIKAVEKLVNRKIWENISLNIGMSTLKESQEKGVIAFFGEKYNPEKVRVVQIPGFSAELCGGTHVQATGDIGCFKITEVSALSAGTRRIVAITGNKALETFQDDFNIIKHLSHEFKVQPQEVLGAVSRQQSTIQTLNMEVRQLKKQLYNTCITQWANQIKTVNDIPFLLITLEYAANDEMRDIANQLKDIKPGFYILISNNDDRSAFIATAAPSVNVNLKEFSEWLKNEHGLRGGGNDQVIQGGGNRLDTSMLTEAIKAWISKS